MSEIIKNEDFLKMHELWDAERKRRIAAEDRVRYLEGLNRLLNEEVEKLQRWYFCERGKNENNRCY